MATIVKSKGAVATRKESGAGLPPQQALHEGHPNTRVGTPKQFAGRKDTLDAAVVGNEDAVSTFVDLEEHASAEEGV